jgi:FKBP-type peptidyl-prolyl cis-trans isomerase FkpA
LRRSLVCLTLLAAVGCGGGQSAPSSPAPIPDSGTLVVEDLVVGTGPAVVVGNVVTVEYVGTLQNGTQFDSSYAAGAPFTFTVGDAQLIAGWNQGIPGMQVGGKRRLTIPPSLGYGSRAVGPIPPNSTLIFEIDLISIDR